MIKKNLLPEKSRLDEFFQYDGTTGDLTWKKSKGCVRAGTIVKTTNADGYITVHFDGVSFLAHRIIWKMVTGCDPADEIDHINNIRRDNSWSNLRECDRCQNTSNSRTPITNSSGVKGVHYHIGHNKWHAKIRHKRSEIHLGYFDTIEEASAAIEKSRAELHGEFARAA